MQNAKSIHLLLFRHLLQPSVVPLLDGHVPDYVTTVSASKDEQTGHEQVSDVEHVPLTHPEPMQELVWHVVEFVLKME